MSKERILGRREVIKKGAGLVSLAASGLLLKGCSGNLEDFSVRKEDNRVDQLAHGAIVGVFKRCGEEVLKRKGIAYPPATGEIACEDAVAIFSMLNWASVEDKVSLAEALQKTHEIAEKLYQANLGEMFYRLPEIGLNVKDVSEQMIPEWEGKSKIYPTEGNFLVPIALPYNFRQGGGPDEKLHFSLIVALVGIAEKKGVYLMRVTRAKSPFPVRGELLPKSLDSIVNLSVYLK